jgi:hypothetical protein
MVSVQPLAGVSLVLAVACSSNPPANNGVNDVRKACDIRRGWLRKDGSQCINCQVSAPALPCPCSETDPVLSKCHDQQKAVNAEPQCAGIDRCVGDCKDECACIDRCYAGREACYRVASAMDGCVADLCDSRCR